MTFSWQPSKHTGGTDALMYRLELWEKRVDGLYVGGVMLYNVKYFRLTRLNASEYVSGILGDI